MGQNANTESFASLGITGEYINIEGLKPVITPGLAGELRIGKVVGAKYSLAITKDYYHMGSGLLFYPLFLLADKTESEYAIIFLLLTLFEHTNFHIRLNDNIEFVPYFSLLRVRYRWDENNVYNESVFASGSVGSSLNFWLGGKWSINVFGEGTQLYRSERPHGWQTGAGLVYHFPDKKQ